MGDDSLAEVMERHPELNTFGIGVFSPSSKSAHAREVELAQGRVELAQREARVFEVAAWLRENLRPIQTPSQGSYHLKHLAEKTDLGYISNGELIAAAFIVGYHYRYEPPNVRFGVSALDVRRLESDRR